MDTTQQLKGKSMQELHRLVREDAYRFALVAEAWNELTVSQQVELVNMAQALRKQSAE
jgi:hypothetical protein